MNPTVAKLLSAVNKLMGEENPVKRQNGKIGHEPTPQKRVRTKQIITNKQKILIERRGKKRRKMAAQSRKTNRLRGVGI